MPSRRTALAATALAGLALLGSSCSSTVAGTPSFGAASGSVAPGPSGLASKPLKEITATVESFTAKQKSVHIRVEVDGDLFSDADISDGVAEGVTVVDEEKVQFRLVDGTVYVQKDGDWSEAGEDLGETIQSRTRFADVQREFANLDKDVKKAKPATEDGKNLIELSDNEGGTAYVLDDADNAAPQRMHLSGDSSDNDVFFTNWSEDELDVDVPAVS